MANLNPVLNAILIGYRLAGRFLHAPFMMQNSINIKYVVSGQLEVIRNELPNARSGYDLEAFLDDPAIDLVVVTSPNTAHFQHAKAALEAGKHVVVDKPFTLTSQEAVQLVAAAECRNLVLSCYFNRRWDSDYLTLRKVISSGDLGRLVSFEARWDRWRPTVRDRWREQAGAGSGLLFDLAPHFLDQATQILGVPDWIEADTARQRDGAVTDDFFEIRMGVGAVRVAIGASCFGADPGFRFRLRGTSGTFVKHGLDQQETHVRSGLRPGQGRFGCEPDSLHGHLTDSDGTTRVIPSERGNWLAYYQGIINSIRKGEPPPVTAREGLLNMMLLELAVKAAATGSRQNAIRLRDLQTPQLIERMDA